MIIQLKKVRLSFPELFEAKAVNGQGAPAYSASFILPTDHPQVKEIKAAMKAVAKEKWGAKADAIYAAAEKGDKLGLHDGDTKEYDGYAGNLYISARNKTRPLVVDKDKTPLTASDGKPYGGCIVNASLEVWAQDNDFGKRINFSLRGVQFVEDGDRFGGGGVAGEDDFDDLGDGADAEDLF